MQIQRLKTHNDLTESTASYYMTRYKRGFTLVEILVVLAIIGILLGVGVSAIKGLATSKGVSTAVPLAESVFEQARIIAKNGTPTRVVIYADDTGTIDEHRNRYLRMMAVATGRVDSDGTLAEKGEPISEWKLVSLPVSISSGAYFNDNLSTHSGQGTALFPGGSAKKCFVYEFNSEGALIAATNNGGGDTIKEGKFIIQAGKLNPKAATPIEDSGAKRDVGGFRVFKNGRIATFQSPNQIVDAGTDPTF